MSCYLNGVRTDALWDTGAQVTIISDQWRHDFLPNQTLGPIEELLSGELSLKAANSVDIPFLGWINVTFTLAGDDDIIEVPTLVTPDPLDTPIIGYNVITEVTKSHSGADADVKLTQAMLSSLRAQPQDIPNLINLLRQEQDDEIGRVKSGRKRITIPSTKTVAYLPTLENQKTEYKVLRGREATEGGRVWELLHFWT